VDCKTESACTHSKSSGPPVIGSAPSAIARASIRSSVSTTVVLKVRGCAPYSSGPRTVGGSPRSPARISHRTRSRRFLTADPGARASLIVFGRFTMRMTGSHGFAPGRALWLVRGIGVPPRSRLPEFPSARTRSIFYGAFHGLVRQSLVSSQAGADEPDGAAKGRPWQPQRSGHAPTGHRIAGVRCAAEGEPGGEPSDGNRGWRGPLAISLTADGT
jgi:predicted lipid-binding transport protein (Tim44 family)